jgi:hypothetical protein
MPRTPASLRYLTLHRFAFAVTALTVLVTAVATAATAAFASASAAAANRQALAADPVSSILVTAQAQHFGDASRLVSRVLSGGAPGLPLRVLTARQSDPLDLPSGFGGHGAQTLLLSAAAARQHLRLVGGTWPATNRGAGGVVPVCAPAAAAHRLRLAPGDTLTLRDSISLARARVRIACIYAEAEPASAYWQLWPLGPAAVSTAGGFTVYGPLITAEPAAAWPVPAPAAAWLAVPDFAAMTASDLQGLSSSVGAAITKLTNSASLGPTVTSGLPGLLSDQAVALEVARSQLLIGQLIVLVVAGAALVVAVRLLASRRAGEPGLLMARGATRLQLAARGGADAALLAVPAAVAGPLLGARLAPLVARLGSIGGGPVRLPAGLPAAAWLAGLGVGAGCAVIIALPWLRRPRTPVSRRAAAGRDATIGAALSSGADLAVAALAAGAGWQLSRYSAPVSSGLGGAIGIDPVLVVAPALALTAGTLLMLRLLPLLTRLTERAAARGRGITVATAAWMISRRTLRQAGPALLAVMAVAISVLALGEVSSWQQSVRAQAGFAVGANASLTLPPAGQLPVGQVADVTAARGVAAAMPVIAATFSLPDNNQAEFLALDPALARRITPVRSDLAVKPATDPYRPIEAARAAPGEVLPGRPRQLQVAASLSRSGLSGASLMVQLSDAAGVSYQLPAGPLPADGARQRFDVTIGSHADYPLTLTGFDLSYQLPLARPAQRATLTVGPVRPVGSRGQAGPPLPAVWLAGHAAPEVSISAPQLQSPQGDSAYGPPRHATLSRPAQQGILTFDTGAGVTNGSPADATVAITPRAPAAVPAIATRAFLTASGQHLGAVVEVSPLSQPVPVLLAGEVTAFPTVTSPGGGLIVNQAALQAYLEASGAAPAPVTQWWTSGTGRPAFAYLPAGSTVQTVAAVRRSLSNQLLALAPLRSMLAVTIIALVLACLGFIVSVGTVRERGRDIAVLDALGATPRQLAGVVCLEQGIVSVPAAAGGLALGLVLSRLVIPAVTLTAQATRPLPPVLVRIPLPPVLVIAAVIAAFPVAAVAVSVLRGTQAAARLRAEEDA